MNYEVECDEILSRFKIKFFKLIIHNRKLAMTALKMLNNKKEPSEI